MPSPSNATQLSIVAIIPSLRAGGAERVLAGLAGDLAEQGHHMSLLTLMPPREPPFYPLADAVEHVGLGRSAGNVGIGDPLGLLRASADFRREIRARRPGVVLGFTTLGSILAVLATRWMSVPVVAAERVDPGGHGRRIGRLKAGFRDFLYGRADHVVVQTMRGRRSLGWLPEDRISCIPNPVHAVAGRAKPDQPGRDGRFRMLAVGRLDAQKGFDLLIDAFGQVAAQYPLWDLVIWGEGPERQPLQSRIASLGLGGRVRMPGVTPDLGDELLTGHAFAFPSRYEGFPNALSEAMASGLPCVAMRDVSGVEDLIVGTDGKSATGLLCDWRAPVDDLAHHLADLMSNPALRLRLGANARAHVTAFSPQMHYERWETLLRQVRRAR